jgi:hypothetical protein
MASDGHEEVGKATATRTDFDRDVWSSPRFVEADMSWDTELRCKKHPKAKRRLMPTNGCGGCWRVYFDTLSDDGMWDFDTEYLKD